MRSALYAMTITMFMISAGAAQTPDPGAEPLKWDSPACLENPYNPKCPRITVTPGASNNSLQPQGGGIGGGIDIKGLRPMDRPSFDRDTLRLPKALD